jgi:hypothetical protein
LGINYFNVNDAKRDHMDWKWLTSLPKVKEKTHVVHAISPKPFTLKVDGREGIGVIIDSFQKGLLKNN